MRKTRRGDSEREPPRRRVVTWVADDRRVRDAKEIARFAHDVEKGAAREYDQNDEGNTIFAPRKNPPLYETDVSVRSQALGVLVGLGAWIVWAVLNDFPLGAWPVGGAFAAVVGGVVANLARSGVHWLRTPRGGAAVEARRFRVEIDAAALDVFVDGERRVGLPLAEVARVRAGVGRVELVRVDGGVVDVDARFDEPGEAEAMARRLDEGVSAVRRGDPGPYR